MPDSFKPLSEVEWVEQLVCDRYKVKIPKFLADYHAWWGWWEKDRFKSMQENLKHGDILFDVGAEAGWISAIYAQFVGGENMCLFEPTPEVWPAIKGTWEQNSLAMPRTTCCALVSNSDVYAPELATSLMAVDRGWPLPAYEAMLLENVKYNHIDEDAHRRPQIRLDTFVEFSGIKPSAITIDVEGAELMVLRGAEKTLKEARPLVWVSVHEQAMVDRYKMWPKELYEFMANCLYMGEMLGEDHEQHWAFKPGPQ